MKATIQKIDGELAVVIPQDLLSALDIDENTPLSVGIDGGRLVVTPEKTIDRQAQFDAALESTIERRGDALKRLAEGPGWPPSRTDES